MKKNTLFLLALLFIGSFATAMERDATISVQELYQRIERIKPMLHNTETGDFSFDVIMQSVKDEMRQFRYIDSEVASSIVQEIFHSNGYRKLDETIHDLVMQPINPAPILDNPDLNAAIVQVGPNEIMTQHGVVPTDELLPRPNSRDFFAHLNNLRNFQQQEQRHPLSHGIVIIGDPLEFFNMLLQNQPEVVQQEEKSNREFNHKKIEKDENCAICQENLLNPDQDHGLDNPDEIVCLNPCDHHYHKECILPWFNGDRSAGKQCPQCREIINKLTETQNNHTNIAIEDNENNNEQEEPEKTESQIDAYREMMKKRFEENK